MTQTTPIDLSTQPPFTRNEAADHGRVEYLRFADALAALETDDRGLATDCDGWTVRDLAGHLCGAVMTATKIRSPNKSVSAVSSATSGWRLAPSTSITATGG